MVFKNPANQYTEEVSSPGMWVLLFGCFYFAVKGVWTHFIVGFIIVGTIATLALLVAVVVIFNLLTSPARGTL
jgi:hypothetical protein